MPADVHFDVGIAELLAGEGRADPAKDRTDASDELDLRNVTRHEVRARLVRPGSSL